MAYLSFWTNAKHIAKHEKVDLFVVELATLLHDIADWKFNEDDNAGPHVAREWLTSLSVDEDTVEHVCQIVKHISFKGALVKNKINTREGMVVQDADRLDAIGAVGIARAFAYGGSSGRKIYDPSMKPKKHSTFEEYKNSNSSTINHFYEKLLLLKDRMNTETAKKIAKKRHKVMEHFLKDFFREWENKT